MLYTQLSPYNPYQLLYNGNYLLENRGLVHKHRNERLFNIVKNHIRILFMKAGILFKGKFSESKIIQFMSCTNYVGHVISAKYDQHSRVKVELESPRAKQK